MKFSPMTVLTRTVDIIIEQKNILVNYLSHLLMGDQGIVLTLTCLQRTTVCMCVNRYCILYKQRMESFTECRACLEIYTCYEMNFHEGRSLPADISKGSFQT